jgi:hypothetical protein
MLTSPTQVISAILRFFDRKQGALQVLLGIALTLGVFALYVQTLVPTVLDGDQGEYQYVPAALGILHSTGFPLYLLLGHLWSFLPIGSLAYRMNLFSAFWGALTVGALFFLLRRLNLHLIASVGAAIAVALMPEYWKFSTAAAVYRLHDLIIVLLFATLVEWDRARQNKWLWLAALLFGLGLATHLTTLFLAPVTGIFALWIIGRTIIKQPRPYFIAALLIALPCVLYLYFPIRASQLALNEFILPDWPKVIAQGIVSPLYENSPV